MFSRFVHRLLLLLVLLASGDDLNMLRVALACTWDGAPVGSTELDDPNADFLVVADAAVTQPDSPLNKMAYASIGSVDHSLRVRCFPVSSLRQPSQTPLRC